MTKPNLPFLFALALVSASALAYEILLMRLFSIIQWHHFAYMIISLALLGYGVSGVFLAFKRGRLVQNFPLAIIANIILFSIAQPACFLLAQAIPFNPAEMLWSPVQLGYLCGLYLLLALPFFFAANVIGLSFYRYQGQISFIYAADLLGAGVGSVLIIALLFLLFPQKLLLVLLLSDVTAAIIMANYGFRGQSINTGPWLKMPVILGIAVVLVLTSLIPLAVSPYKSLNKLLLIPGAKIIGRDSSPLGTLSVVASGTTPLRYAPGLSLNATTEPPEQLAVFTDADNMAAITRYDNNPETLSYLDQTTSALPYHLDRLANVLILGAGTGSDILQATYHGVDHIDAVELNPQTVNLVKNTYADFAGHLYSSPAVGLHIDEARGYLAASKQRYDLINIALLDAFGASANGVYSMAESYLYTEQAIQTYLQHLNTDGFLSITRWTKLPPRDEVKLAATVISALKRAGIPDPGQRLLMIRSWQTSTLLVKNGTVLTADINRLGQFCNQHSFDPVYFPRITAAQTNNYTIQPEPYLYQAVTALLGDNSDAFIEAYKFNIEPATDDRPYLFHFFKWRTLPESWALMHNGGSFLLESGYLLLVVALVQALAASLLLIALPLWLWRDKLGITPDTRNLPPVLGYFFCLGLAFLMIEIAFIQKFILILHHPLFAITTVLGAFLLSAGAGSHYSQNLTRNLQKSPVRLPIAGIVTICAVYILGFESISGFVLAMGSLSRYLISVALVAPLGFCMGMPFPLGLARLGQTTPALIPWAWGINGCASVISAILATLIAMQFGFTVLIFLALVLYGIAAWCFPSRSIAAYSFASSTIKH